MIEVKIESEFIKLDQFLKYENLVFSGGEAKNVIFDGLVMVNGQIETQRGKKLRPGDIVEFMGQSYKII